MLLTGGASDDPPFSWRGFDIEFHTMKEAQLVNEDGTPLPKQQ